MAANCLFRGNNDESFGLDPELAKIIPNNMDCKTGDDNEVTVINSSPETSSIDNKSVITPVSTPSPNNIQKRLLSEKKRLEREKERQEREKKKQQEKEERAKTKLEKEEQRRREREEKEELKRKEREDREEQKRKEREEKERQKELERKQKEEREEQRRKEKEVKDEQKRKEKEEREEQKKREREEKEEQRRKEKEAREEERRKKQESIDLEKQEQELKKKKAAEAFFNFFVPKQKEQQHSSDSKNNILSNFTVKSDMRLAPLCREHLCDADKNSLEKLIESQETCKSNLYLNSLREKRCKPRTMGKTWPSSDKDDDVVIIEDDLPIDGAAEQICESAPQEKLRAKLLRFHENRRPPYWGTWRKTSDFIKPRRPFGQDNKQLDYEIDSDSEWEEEEGESLEGSVAGSDEEGPDEYEVDNELFVPHGYLSDEEATVDEDDIMTRSPETQKALLKHLEDEFESEMKKPTEKLKPRLYGLIWENKECGKPETCVDALWNYFGKFSMLMNNPVLEFNPEAEDSEKKITKKRKILEDSDNQSPKGEKKRKPNEGNRSAKKNKTESKISPKPKKKEVINSFFTKLKTP